MKYLYHVTTKDKCRDILVNGLIPSIGEQSEKVSENKPAIYLCDYEEVGKWKIVLGKDTVLRIKNTNENLLEIRDYPSFHEYICFNKIEPYNIELTNVNSTKQQMQELCCDYTLHLCCLVTKIIRYYDGYYDNDEKVEEWIRHTAKSTMEIMNRFNFDLVKNKRIISTLVNAALEGEYTFLDTYNNTEYRLYEQIIRFPKDDLYDVRKELHDFITKTYEKCLHINTGGYTKC